MLESTQTVQTSAEADHMKSMFNVNIWNIIAKLSYFAAALSCYIR